MNKAYYMNLNEFKMQPNNFITTNIINTPTF